MESEKKIDHHLVAFTLTKTLSGRWNLLRTFVYKSTLDEKGNE